MLVDLAEARQRERGRGVGRGAEQIFVLAAADDELRGRDSWAPGKITGNIAVTKPSEVQIPGISPPSQIAAARFGAGRK